MLTTIYYLYVIGTLEACRILDVNRCKARMYFKKCCDKFIYKRLVDFHLIENNN